MPDITIRGVDLDKLHHIASLMVKTFPAGLTIGLIGTLGAGKTTFTQAVAASAGVDAEDVTSPTFTLLSSYAASIDAGPIDLHHLDAYRVSDEDEFIELGVDELFDSEHAWVLIEWADRVVGVMPDDTLWIRIELDAESIDVASNRTLTFVSDDASLVKLAESLVDQIRN